MAENRFHHFAFSVVERRQSAGTQVLTETNRCGADKTITLFCFIWIYKVLFCFLVFFT